MRKKRLKIWACQPTVNSLYWDKKYNKVEEEKAREKNKKNDKWKEVNLNMDIINELKKNDKKQN